MARLLIGRIVASRAVRHGQPQLELAPVERLAVDRHADHADHDDTALADATDLGGRVDRLVGFRRRRDDDGVGAMSRGEAGDRRGKSLADRDIGAELTGELRSPVVRIEAEHAAAVGLEQLHGEQADEPEPHHDEPLAQRRRRDPHPLQGDRAERDEARVLVVDAGRDRHRQVLRDRVDLRMVGEPGAGAGDAVADRDAGHPAADLDHLAGEAVAERDRRIELGKHLFQCRPDAVALHVAQDAADEIGTRHGLAGERRLGELHELLLGAGADERDARRDQHAALAGPWGGDVGDPQHAGPVVLLHLLHDGLHFRSPAGSW